MFGRRRKQQAQEVQHDTRVKVVVNKQATQEKVKVALDTNKRLLDALEPNHITLKLFIATGGKIKHINRGSK